MDCDTSQRCLQTQQQRRHQQKIAAAENQEIFQNLNENLFARMHDSRTKRAARAT